MIKQNFILDQPPETVDFILLVNWGFTEEVQDDYEFLDQEMVVIDLDDGFQTTEMVDIGSTNSFSTVGSDNAKLIGAMKMSQLYPYSLKRRLLLEASEEKRLFINVTAFEKSHLQNKFPEDSLKPSWITFLVFLSIILKRSMQYRRFQKWLVAIWDMIGILLSLSITMTKNLILRQMH